MVTEKVTLVTLFIHSFLVTYKVTEMLRLVILSIHNFLVIYLGNRKGEFGNIIRTQLTINILR